MLDSFMRIKKYASDRYHVRGVTVVSMHIMTSKVLALVMLHLLSCSSEPTMKKGRHLKQSSEETNSSSTDLDPEASLWRPSPWRLFNWGRPSQNKEQIRTPDRWERMRYGQHRPGHHNAPKLRLKNKRMLTRRDSSLILQKRNDDKYESEGLSTARGASTARLTTDSTTSFMTVRPKCSVQKELVTMLFESMLDCIVDSWEVISPRKTEESSPYMDFDKTVSELTYNKKKKSTAKPSKSKRSRSKLELFDSQDVMQPSWWSAPDERALIYFKNGNVYEGGISMKCMHGEGRFQWADGTVYLGQFRDNEIFGCGTIQWKDDTWYEGEFAGNLRHGRGLFVDSRLQRSYTGGWHRGAKHGEGVIYYSGTFKNSYDGQWIQNVRHGLGSREYSETSGYKGEWNMNGRDGRGLMIWPNSDFYKGEWKNGVMSGYGVYIWGAHYNNTMSLPSLIAYRGLWEKGKRNGYGLLTLGLGMGSHYKGEFNKNKKHGVGKFVTNNGLILQDKNLFIDDNFGSLTADDKANVSSDKLLQAPEPYKFNICDDTVGLLYHIDVAIKNILDTEADIRSRVIEEYMEANKLLVTDISLFASKDQFPRESTKTNLEDLVNFEESSLRKSLRCYETDLKDIYYKYATVCNTEEIHFTPILIRLYLWQLYYDCNIHEKGLTLVDIDKIFHKNPEWLSRTPHNPFEKIYFWQFLHSLISVASRLYAKKELPGPKPDTILANAFRTFMEMDVLPGVGRRKGRLVDSFGKFVPLNATYALYRALGEPHNIRKYLCAVRKPPHVMDSPQPSLVETPDEYLPIGMNSYVIGDDMTFVTDDPVPEQEDGDINTQNDIKLFNFGNLSSKAIIKIFAQIFPQLYEANKIMDLTIEITFFEFFEAFVACAEESIRVKDEELRWREKFSMTNEPPTTPALSSIGTKHK